MKDERTGEAVAVRGKTKREQLLTTADLGLISSWTRGEHGFRIGIVEGAPGVTGRC